MSSDSEFETTDFADAHTSNNRFRINQQPIPCRPREAAFALDGLLEHDTELDPRVYYTDTHGYTEVVIATAALLGRAEGQVIDDDILGPTTPLFRKHVNPFGKYTSILNGCARLRVAQSKVSLNGGFRADVPNTPLAITHGSPNSLGKRPARDCASFLDIVALLSALPGWLVVLH